MIHSLLSSTNQLMIRFFTVVILSLLQLAASHAQRYKEEEIQLQDLYIQAIQKKLLSKYDDAIKLYEKIVEKDPLNGAVHNDMAKIYLAQEKWNEAIPAAKKAVQFAPDNVWYLYTLNEAYGYNGNYEAQANTLQKMILLKEDEDLYLRMAESWLKAKNVNNAIAVYKEVLNKYGWSELQVDHLIDVYLKSDDEDNAEKLIKEYIKRQPNDISRIQKLGEFYLFTGKKSKAKKVFEEVMTMDATHPGASYQLALMEKSQSNSKGEDKMAFIVNDTRLGMDEKIKSMIPLLEQYLNSDQKDDNTGDRLLRYAEDIVTQYPDAAKAHALLADVHYAKNEINDAITEYQKAIDLDKSIYNVWLQMMICYTLSTDYESLRSFSAMAIDYYPNQSGPYYYHAMALLQLGSYSEAAEYADESAFMSGSNGADYQEILILQSRIAQKQGNIDEAIDFLSKMHSSQSESSESLELMGDLMKLKGDKSQAEKYWRRAIENGGNKPRLNQKLQSI